MITDKRIRQIIQEELTKSEVNSMISQKLSSERDSKDFEKRVKEIAADAISNFCKALFYRESMWKSDVKR